MTAYVLQRLIQSVLVLLAVSVVVFFAVYGIGDPIELLVSPQVSDAERQALIRRLGLDLPVWQQYLTFMGNALYKRPATRHQSDRLSVWAECGMRNPTADEADK